MSDELPPEQQAAMDEVIAKIVPLVTGSMFAALQPSAEVWRHQIAQELNVDAERVTVVRHGRNLTVRIALGNAHYVEFEALMIRVDDDDD